jgi:Tfp pilus assembly protein PilF
LELIKNRNLGEGEFGRAMTAVAVTLVRKLYPDVQTQFPPVDPPRVHTYTRILENAERGIYVPPPANSQDYLELVLPFLSLLGETSGESFLNALPNLEYARTLNPDSVLVPYFIGLVYERTGQKELSMEEYRNAYDMARDCYPAALGLARMLNASGRTQEGISLLSDLVIQYPDNVTNKRQLALAYYNNRDWSRAGPVITEVLQRDSQDGEFILMQARLLVEQGQFIPAQTPLDLYGSLYPSNQLYLFLRARVQAEGYRNRDGALNYLRSILRSYPAADEVLVYATRLLMESSRTEDQAEGRGLLNRLLNSAGEEVPSLMVITLAVQDAVHREAWREARTYLSRLLQERRSSQDLLYACTVERGLGNKALALSYARELYENAPSFEEGIIAYISALIDTGRQADADQLIGERLAALSGGVLKSRYYYLRSRLQTTEEAVMSDLRLCLFEDPRNLNALIGMFEIYHRRKDERRAVYYLKQALARAPENPLLKRYEADYGALISN